MENGTFNEPGSLAESVISEVSGNARQLRPR